jgi:hypothetical protein
MLESSAAPHTGAGARFRLIVRWSSPFRTSAGTAFEQCEFGPAVDNNLANISNNVGIDFNFQKSGNQVDAVTFQDAVISDNATNGVKATNVSAAMNVINWYATTCQNNYQSATGNAQFAQGSVQGFTIKGLYMEYVLGGTLPDAIDRRCGPMAACATSSLP